MTLESQLTETLKSRSRTVEARYFNAPMDAMRSCWLPVMSHMETRWQRMGMRRNWRRWFRVGADIEDRKIAEAMESVGMVDPVDPVG